MYYSKTCFKQLLKKKTKTGFQDRLSLNAGQKYCRMLQGEYSAILLTIICLMLQGEHSAIRSTFIKLLLAIMTFVLSIFEWPLKTGFTVYDKTAHLRSINRAFTAGTNQKRDVDEGSGQNSGP